MTSYDDDDQSLKYCFLLTITQLCLYKTWRRLCTSSWLIKLHTPNEMDCLDRYPRQRVPRNMRSRHSYWFLGYFSLVLSGMKAKESPSVPFAMWSVYLTWIQLGIIWLSCPFSLTGKDGTRPTHNREASPSSPITDWLASKLSEGNTTRTVFPLSFRENLLLLGYDSPQIAWFVQK